MPTSPRTRCGAEAERELLSRVTDLLLEHEGADPSNEQVRSIAWLFVHRPEMYVAGAPAEEPHYKFVCQVPEGQYDEERRAAVTAEITQAVVEAEARTLAEPRVPGVGVQLGGSRRHVGRTRQNLPPARHRRIRLTAGASGG